MNHGIIFFITSHTYKDITIYISKKKTHAYVYCANVCAFVQDMFMCLCK